MAKINKKFKRSRSRAKKIKKAAGSAGVSSQQNILQQALVHHQAGRLAQAEALYRQILLVEPNHPEALYYLGVLAHEVGKNGIAAELFNRAVASNPENAEAHYNLGNVLDDLGRMDEAAASYCRAITLKPGYVEAHYNLGLLFQGQGRSDEAAAGYRRAITLKPDYVEAYNNLGIILKDQGRLNEAVANFRRALTLKPDYLEAQSNLLFCLNYLPGQTVSDYLNEARCYGRQVSARADAPFSSWNCDFKPEQLRVGLVSDDFRNHPVGYFLENILVNIDSAKIQLIAYPISNVHDELTARIRSRFAAWKPLSGMDDASAVRLIHDDAVHVLLDLSGHTSNNRLPLFAWKPAPVQATWLGYFASTGVEEMAYIISDPVSIPESHQDNFTEKVWYIPETRVCFSPPVKDKELDLTPLPALNSGCITFGSFQNLAKLNDEVLSLWGRIFQELPQARLRLQNSQFNSQRVQEELMERLARKGIAPEKVTFEKAVPRLEYLAAHAHIDIILDTFPFTGLTTTCEALWMGVPTLTLAGNTMVARQGASLLACVGMSEWISGDEEDYVAKALKHAADFEKLAKLRAGLRRQVSASPLFDGPQFARNFETALWGMWCRFEEDWNNGRLE